MTHNNMPDHSSTPKTSFGLMALLAIILIDIGLGVWLWYRRQANQNNYDFTSMNLPTVDETDTSVPAYQPPAGPAPPPSGGQPATPITPKAQRQGIPQSLSAKPSAPTAGSMPPAAAAFIALQRSSKYQKSGMVQRWRHDFLKYPDLKAVNQRFWQDHNLVNFVIGTLRSPNFHSLITQYASTTDIQAFAKDLMAMPGVMAAGRSLMENPQVLSAAKNVSFPGLPPLGTLMKMGENGSPASLSNSQNFDRLQNDPNVGKFIQQQNAPVPLQNNP